MNQMTSVSPQPNAGQQAAADEFFTFLFSDNNEFNISGPGGVGKTFLMSYMIDTIMPQYLDTCKMMGIEPEFDEVVMTATTNKAAEVLHQTTQRPTQTIQSFLNLKVVDDFKTGESKLSKTTAWKVHERKIIFIDECSMIDSKLYHFIHEGTAGCKIVYVGDHCQLAPVMERISPVYRQKMPFCELTEPMRNAGEPALMAVCDQLRHTVETNEFQPIKIVPGVIDHLDDYQMQAEIAQAFAQQTLDSRILAYTNQRVIEFNDHIRGVRQLPEHYTLGEFLVNNGAIRLKGNMFSVEEEVEISRLDSKSSYVRVPDATEDVDLEVIGADLTLAGGGVYHDVKLPVDRDHFRSLVRHYAKKKDWESMYFLKNHFPDLRPRDAGTVYKAQGSTYDTTFIDLGNISTCHNPNQVARMLYVAFSRARSRIVLYGQLADKYGGLTH